MTTNGHTELAQIGVRLLDDAYLAWLTAEADCQRKLDVWRTASRGKLAGAYLAYRAALDREDAAAHDLERLAELAGPSCDTFLAHARG